MSFSSLPTELVRQVIESSVPSTFHSTTYSERQSTLLHLCLVSRRFFQIAQPLLFEIVRIDEPWKLDALLNSLTRKRGEIAVRQAIVRDNHYRLFDAGRLEKLLRSSQSLITLTLDSDYGRPLDLSVLQDLPYLMDLSLFGSNCQFPSYCRLYALTSYSFNYSVAEVAAAVLDPAILPSLRSLALLKIYNDGGIVHLNKSRLVALIPQLETLFLDSPILRQRLDYLVPALPRTLFDLYPPSNDDFVNLLQVAQHVRIPQDRYLDEVLPKFVQFMENQDRQIHLHSIYLDTRLANLPSLSVDVCKAVQDLVRVCRERKIEVVHEVQETISEYYLSPSAEFRRRQIRTTEAAQTT